MRGSVAGRLTGICAAVLLGGCAAPFLNEGASQVRHVQVKSASGDLPAPALYFNKEGLSDRLIQEGDYFSVSLLSAHICQFTESSKRDGLIIDRSNPVGRSKKIGCAQGGASKPAEVGRITRGEVAILANFGETSPGKGFLNSYADLERSGRVIYYNNDIRKSGQLINAINMPIFGPKQYNGKSVFFDFWMLELDGAENENFRSLMSSMAALGGKAYPPSAPVVGVLNFLGGAFLKGNADDVEFHYQMKFDPPAPESKSALAAPEVLGFAQAASSVARKAELAASAAQVVADQALASKVGFSDAAKSALAKAKDTAVETKDLAKKFVPYSSVKRLPLAEGYYVFMREESRDQDPEWAAFRVDEDRGVLCAVDVSKECHEVYRDRTWFLVRIAREKPEAGLDIEYGEYLSAFLQKISNYETLAAKDFDSGKDAMGDGLKEFLCERGSASIKSKLGCQ